MGVFDVGKSNEIILFYAKTFLTLILPRVFDNTNDHGGGGNHPTKFTPRCDKTNEHMINVLSVPKSLSYYGYNAFYCNEKYLFLEK